MAELFPPQGQWTEEDYFALPDTNRYVELSDGELVMPPHPTFRHQEALKRLFIRLNTFFVRLWPGKIRGLLRGRWGPGETASSEPLRGFEVKVDGPTQQATTS